MRILLGCLLALVSGSTAASASVIYILTGTNSDGIAEQFHYKAPDFVTTQASVYIASLDFCVACTTLPFLPIYFYPNLPHAEYGSVDSIQFPDSNGSAYPYYFPGGAFAAYGTYTTLIGDNAGTLEVGPPHAPEPAAILLTSPALLLFWRKRRRLA